ncbi:glycosyltransferase [Aeromonas salmonicida]|uniref:glycosyltransferase n=1 Tax=Aeromonas salmonicida TaxID=645 RepID=UPI0013A68FD7|nr:glycosyltransferase [Aeromonas salmonicida]
MKKILIFRTCLLPYSETFISTQVHHLKHWSATLLGETKMDNGLSLDGINVETLLASQAEHHALSMQRALNDHIQSEFLSRAELYKNAGYKLIHAHFAVDGLRVYPLAKQMNVPLIITLHGYDININKEWWHNGCGGRSMASYPEKLVAISRADNVHFLAVSEAIKARAIDYGLPEEKITVSYIGVDCEQFKPLNIPMSERKQVLFVGRLVEKKGCQYILSAFRKIQDKFEHIELVVVGNGPQELMLKNFAIENNIRVRFLGAVGREEIKQELSKTRVFCLPSITAENGDAEGLPIVVLEAQSCGVPVITSARGGATEGIIDSVTGYAHQEKDIDEISSMLDRLLSDDILSKRMGVNAREHILKKMDINHCTRQLEDIYNKLYFESNKQ